MLNRQMVQAGQSSRVQLTQEVNCGSNAAFDHPNRRTIERMSSRRNDHFAGKPWVFHRRAPCIPGLDQF
jgi:hypothetical protein